MKSMAIAIVIIGSMSSGIAGAQDNTPCINLEERIALNKIQADLADAKITKPGCEEMWGAAGCIPPLAQKEKQFYESKLKGDPEACTGVPIKSIPEQAYEEAVVAMVGFQCPDLSRLYSSNYRDSFMRREQVLQSFQVGLGASEDAWFKKFENDVAALSLGKVSIVEDQRENHQSQCSCLGVKYARLSDGIRKIEFEFVPGAYVPFSCEKSSLIVEPTRITQSVQASALFKDVMASSGAIADKKLPSDDVAPQVHGVVAGATAGLPR